MKTTTFTKISLRATTGIKSGNFVFRCVNHRGEEKDLRVDCATFEALNSPVARTLCIHAQHRDFTAGEPFEIFSKQWEVSNN
jgi:hypothetical protein